MASKGIFVGWTQCGWSLWQGKLAIISLIHMFELLQKEVLPKMAIQGLDRLFAV
jgi:hypothetical protein